MTVSIFLRGYELSFALVPLFVYEDGVNVNVVKPMFLEIKIPLLVV